jgi:hypothetical protein
MNFENRYRYNTFEEVCKAEKYLIGWIAHILFNEDKKDFSIMSHSVCEWCTYCDQRNAAYKSGLRYGDDYPLVHLAVENPYPEEVL